MKEATNDILKRLPTLPPADLRRIRDAVNTLLGDDSRSPRDPEPDDDARRVWRAFMRSAEEFLIELPEFDDLTKSARDELTKHARRAVRWIDRAFQVQNEAERAKADVLVASTVLAEMRETRVPLKPLPLAQQVQHASATFDRAFPGYAEGGCLRFLLTHARVGSAADDE